MNWSDICPISIYLVVLWLVGVTVKSVWYPTVNGSPKLNDLIIIKCYCKGSILKCGHCYRLHWYCVHESKSTIHQTDCCNLELSLLRSHTWPEDISSHLVMLCYRDASSSDIESSVLCICQSRCLNWPAVQNVLYGCTKSLILSLCKYHKELQNWVICLTLQSLSWENIENLVSIGIRKYLDFHFPSRLFSSLDNV